jgi:hypothetical protein
MPVTSIFVYVCSIILNPFLSIVWILIGHIFY